jgi:anaerobic magnesium-protoporphyrin IX monomethyl ester cyclase
MATQANMKVLFVYPNIIYKKHPLGLSHMGIASLAAVLKKDGHAVSVMNIYKKIDREEFITRVINESPNLLAFSATGNMFFYVEEFCKWLLQENLHFKTICGGPHATLVPEEVLKTNGIDMVCIGEGEAALSELCNKLSKEEDATKINNIWIKAEKGTIRNSVAPLLQNLDKLPFPDMSVFNKHELTIESIGILPITASRGCFYNCVYCCNHALRNVYPNKDKYLRFRSPENVVAEIKDVLSRDSSYHSIRFYDDILYFYKAWSRDFTKLYKREISLPFSCNIRPELVDKETVDMLKEAGCNMICMGIESGNDYIRNKILKRHTSKEHIRKAFNMFKPTHIKLHVFNMIGIPHENPSNVLETIKLNSEFLPDTFHVPILYPFPGTEIYDMSKRKGFLTEKKVGSFFNDSTLKLPTISRAQIIMFQRYFVLFVRIYSNLMRLPQPYSRISVAVLDCMLEKKFIALLSNMLIIIRNFFVFIILRLFLPLRRRLFMLKEIQ